MMKITQPRIDRVEHIGIDEAPQMRLENIFSTSPSIFIYCKCYYQMLLISMSVNSTAVSYGPLIWMDERLYLL